MNLKRGFERLEYAVSIVYWVLGAYIISTVTKGDNAELNRTVWGLVIFYLIATALWSGLKWIIMGFAKE